MYDKQRHGSGVFEPFAGKEQPMSRFELRETRRNGMAIAMRAIAQENRRVSGPFHHAALDCGCVANAA